MAAREIILAGLERALNAMNASGAHWTQGTMRDIAEHGEAEGDYRYCSLGALYYASDADIESIYDPAQTGGLAKALESGDQALRRELVYAIACAIPEDERAHDLDSYENQEWAITQWNDYEEREWEEIVGLFARAKEAVGGWGER